MVKQFSVFDFLTDEEIELPEGGGFQPSGMIGPWNMSIFSTFMRQAPPDGVSPKPDNVRQAGQSGWYTYYYRDAVAAKAAAKAANAGSASQVYVFEAETDALVGAANLAKLKESFGEIVTYEVPVHTLGSKNRHQFHMFLLPSAVNAVARRYGYITESLDFSELASSADNFILNDDVQARLIGAPDAKVGDEMHFKNSVYWLRRQKLWAALDEDNDEAYEPIRPLAAGEKAGKYVTKSEKLSNCLVLLQRTWSASHYARMAQIMSPAMDAKSKSSGKPGRVVVMLDFYGDKETAQEAATESQTGAEATAPSANGSNAKPAYPTGWAPADWEGAVSDLLNEGKSASVIAKEMGECTVGDVIAWKKFLGL